MNKPSNNIFAFDFDQDQPQANKQYVNQQIIYEKKQAQLQNHIHKPYFFDDYEDDNDQIAKQKCEITHIDGSPPGKQCAKQEIEHQPEQEDNIKNSWPDIFKERKNNKLQKQQYPENQISKKQVRNNLESSKQNNVLAGLHLKERSEKNFEYVSEKKALKVSDIRKFLNSPLGDYKIKAIIKRINNGFLNTRTKFQVIIEQNHRFLFSVVRDGLTEYIFSLSKENISAKNKNYLGFMDCNVFGTEFKLYDCGFSPDQTRSLEHCRRQLGSIVYESNKGPRKFETIVSTNSQGFYALKSESNQLKDLWDKKKRENLSKLYSQSPEYDSQDGNYKLDFKGIVKKASIKNFILGGKQWKDTLIFGKIDDETFVMEIKQPLSLLQATAICISSIHYKLK